MLRRAPSHKRKEFKVYLGTASIDNKLCEALCHNHKWFDALKKDFPIIIDGMPQYLKDRLSKSLQFDHAIPMTDGKFGEMITDLTKYRHWLEHAPERIEKGEHRPFISDRRLLEFWP